MRNPNRSRDRFTGPMFRRLWAPAMLSSVGWALSDMADAVVVGQKLGTVGLAAISLILPVYMVNCMFAHGFGLGGSVRYARLIGEGKPNEAKENFAQILIMALIFSIGTAILGSVFITPLLRVLGTKPEDGALFESTRAYLRIQLLATPLFYLSNIFNYYLRNDGSEKLAGAGSVIGNVCDIALNLLLVLALRMGTGGAALATALGQIITISIYLPGFFRKSHVLRFALPKRGWFMQSLSMLRAGLATSVQYLYQTIFFLVCNNLLIRIGGEQGIAVFDVLQNTSYLILYLYEGTARAMQPILSTYNGERNLPGQRTLLRYGFGSGILIGSAMILLVVLWPGGICALFGIAGTAVEPLAHLALRIFALGAFFVGINILLCNYLQAYEREKLSFLIETLRGILILLPMTFLCASFGLQGFWWLFPSTEIASALTAILIFAVILWRGRAQQNAVTEERVFRRTIMSVNTDVGTASADLEAFCEKWGATMRQQYTVMMAVEELGLTILQHGFQGREDGYIQITVIAQEDGSFELHLRDNAVRFDPFSLDTDKTKAGGDVDMDSIGVLMIKKRAKEFFYRRYQGFNSLVVKL